MNIRKLHIYIILSLLLVLNMISTPAFAKGITTKVGGITIPHGNKVTGVLRLKDGALYNVTVQEYTQDDDKPSPDEPLNLTSTDPIPLKVSMPDEKFDIDHVTLTLMTDKQKLLQYEAKANSLGQPINGYLKLNNGKENIVYEVNENITAEGYNYKEILNFLTYNWSSGELVLNDGGKLSRLDRVLQIKSSEGYVFNDINGNGIWDKNDKDNPEQGIKNLTVSIVNGQRQTNAVTDAKGYFKRNLPSGSYAMMLGVPGHTICTTNNVQYNTTLDAKQISSSTNIGLLSKGIIRITDEVKGDVSDATIFSATMAKKDGTEEKQFTMKQGQITQLVGIEDGDYIITERPINGYVIPKPIEVSVKLDNLKPDIVTFKNEKVTISAAMITGSVVGKGSITSNRPAGGATTTPAPGSEKVVTGPARANSEKAIGAIVLASYTKPGKTMDKDNKESNGNRAGLDVGNKSTKLSTKNKTPEGLARLTKTGGIGVQVFYGLGLVIILTALIKRKKLINIVKKTLLIT